MTKIKEAIEVLANSKHSKFRSELCVVVSVTINNSKKVVKCESLNTDIVYEEVDLSAEYNNGFIIEPKVGSNVLIGFNDNNTPFVMMYSEIENIFIDVETDIVINGGDNGGVVVVGNLVNKLNALENRLNTHISEYNALVANYNAHQHTSVAPGYPTTPGTPPASGVVSTVTPITPSVVNDLENDKFKH